MDKHIKTVPAKKILLKIAPSLVTEIQTIIEACDGLAIVRALDPDIAVVELLTTDDTYEKTLKLARSLEEPLDAELLVPPVV